MNNIIMVYTNVHSRNPFMIVFTIVVCVFAISGSFLGYSKEGMSNDFLFFLLCAIALCGIFIYGLVRMYYWQKLVVTNTDIEVYGAPANDKKVPIKDIDYFTVIPNWPKPQMIYFDIHGKKRAWDISYFFGRKSEVKEFIKTLQEINPKVKDNINYDSVFIKVLWSDR